MGNGAPESGQGQQDTLTDPLRPKTAEELAQDFSSELAKPASELAVQGIDSQIADLHRRRGNIDQSVAFTRGYKPRHPGPAPHPEAGGMDHQDYDAEKWEYDHYDRDAELDELDARDQELYEHMDELGELRARVERGDATLIEKFSLAEKTRLENEFQQRLWNADREVFDYDTRRGVKLVGSQELLTSLEGLIGSAGEGKQPSNSGWSHEHWEANGQHALPYSHDTFTTDQDGKKITIRVGAKAVPSNGAYYAPPNPDEYTGHLAERLSRRVTISIDKSDYTHEGGWTYEGQKHAEYYGFQLFDDGRVAEQDKWSMGKRHESQVPNVTIGIEDIDKIQGYVNSISASNQHQEQ